MTEPTLFRSRYRGSQIRDSLTARRTLRRGRRNRKTRYRPPRFLNRIRLGLEKSHSTDAVCVGRSTPENLTILVSHALTIKATGHGTRKMCGTDKHGFPIRHRTRMKKHFGFETGDMVKAVVTSGKKAGTYVGRVLCRKSGSFDVTTKDGRVTGINHRFCRRVHRSDGYAYA